MTARTVDVLRELLLSAGLEPPVSEYRFAPPRRWRFDLAWPERRIAVEFNGGVWIRGRHNRGTGYLGDLEKLNRAQALGWRVFQYAPGMPIEPFLTMLCEVYHDTVPNRALSSDDAGAPALAPDPDRADDRTAKPAGERDGRP